jgi:hypothetical protein
MQWKDGAYASIEESTKDRVSFNPKPPKSLPGSAWLSIKIPHKEEGNTNFLGLNHKVGSS